jgi:hypothetical protein
VPFDQIPPRNVVLAVSRVSDAQIEALARRLVTARSWHVPTLGLFERIVDSSASAEQLRAHPAMRFVPEQSLAQWAQQHAGFRAETAYDAETAAAFAELRRRIVRDIHRDRRGR